MNEIVVVMAYYKGQKYFREQIDSIIGQTKIPDKLIIVNDSSFDKEATEYLTNFNYGKLDIEIINNKKNLGYTLSFFIGIKKAYELGFRYIFISDQDDIWIKDKICLQWKELESGADICNHFSQKYVLRENLFLKASVNFSNAAGHSLAFNAKKFEEGFNFFSKAFYLIPINNSFFVTYDNIIALIVLINKLKWTTIIKILVLHRLHEGSQSYYPYIRYLPFIVQIRNEFMAFLSCISSYNKISYFLKQYMQLNISPLYLFFYFRKTINKYDLCDYRTKFENFLFTTFGSIVLIITEFLQTICTFLKNLNVRILKNML